MSVKLSIRIKYSDEKNEFQTQILEQSSRKINHLTKNGFLFRTVIVPEIDKNTFFLQGKLKEKDNLWCALSTLSSPKILTQALYDFAEENNWNFGYVFNDDELKIIISENGIKSSLIDVNNTLLNLKQIDC